jgi:PAP2 superfamily
VGRELFGQPVSNTERSHSIAERSCSNAVSTMPTDDGARASAPREMPRKTPREIVASTSVDRGYVAWTKNWVRNFASQDWITIGYLAALLFALGIGRGENRAACAARVSADLVVFLLVLLVIRGNFLRWGSAASSLTYRTAIIGILLSSFFQLREILPAVSPWTVDARIYAFDLRVFGFEPSVVLDRYVAPATTEWFAFYYFLYFLILCIHVLPMVYWQRSTLLLTRFATGLLLVFMSAHIIYMVVPGFGPYWYLRGSFGHELRGGMFWRLVREAVEAGGAQKDIFPSLHTAAPTYFAIFSYRHRRLAPFRHWWPVIAFLATQIIIATMFLRWHYLVDVVAGLTLAVIGALLGQHVADWECAKRKRLGLQPVWAPLAYPWGRGGDE